LNLSTVYYVVGFILGTMTAAGLGYSLVVEHGHPRARRKLLVLSGACSILFGVLTAWAVNAFFLYVPMMQR